MASIEKRVLRSGMSWRVVWREAGVKQSETFDSQKAADRFRQLVEGSGNTWPIGWVPGVGPANEQPSTAPAFRDYAAKTIQARQRADPRTKADYESMLTNHVYPAIGDIPVDRLDRFQISDISTRMLVAGKSAKTVGNVHALVSSILTDAATDRLIERNPAVGAMPHLPDSKTEEMVFLSPVEFALLASNIDDEYRDLAKLLFGTGLRWSEATALQIHDIDLRKRQALDVRRAWKRRDNRFVLGAPKSNRSRRTITLSAELVMMLERIVHGRDPGEFVFLTPTGVPVRHNNFFNRIWKPAVIASLAQGLPRAPRIHDLRHSHAAVLIADKVSLVAVQRRLGHESITTTIDRYGHLAPEHVDEINAAVDRSLLPPT